MIMKRNLIIFYLIIFIALIIIGLVDDFKRQAPFWFLILVMTITALTALSIVFYAVNFKPKRYIWFWKIVPCAFVLYNLWDMFTSDVLIILPLLLSIAVWVIFIPAIYMSFRFGFSSESGKWLAIGIITGIIVLICFAYIQNNLFKLPPPRTSNYYNEMANNALRHLIVMQEVYFVENETYTKSIARLLYDSDLKMGVALRIISADKSYYKMVSYHENGNKGFLLNGPGTTVKKISKEKAMALFRMDRDVPESSTDRLVMDLRSNDPDIRADAAYYLTRITDKQVVLPLIEALKDVDPLVRLYAAKALGNYKEERLVAPLIEALKDGDPLVRRQAAKALGNYKEPNDVAPLINVLNSAH